MRQVMWALFTDQDGQSMAEYGLLTALIAIVCLAAVKALGSSIEKKFDKLAKEIGASGKK